MLPCMAYTVRSTYAHTYCAHSDGAISTWFKAGFFQMWPSAHKSFLHCSLHL